MRLFTGLSIPLSVVAALESAVSELRPLAPLRWSPVENLHITTKFIGEWPDEGLPKLREALRALEVPAPFEVSVGHFGFLPNPHRPKILLAGVRGGPGLVQLAERTDAALADLGVKREDRAYTPHLTLARIANENISGLRERIAASPVPEFGRFMAREFHLYRSKPGSSGSVYSLIGTYLLEKAAS